MERGQNLMLYNPKDIPFGQLSNNSQHFMTIEGKRWATVTNYILSNMLIVPTYRSILSKAKIQGSKKNVNIREKVDMVLANAKVKKGGELTPSEIEQHRQKILQQVAFQKMDIYQLYNYYLGLESFNNIRRAVENAYTSKVMQNPEMMQALIDSGNVPIYYISNNAQLGVGADGNGMNLIGIMLMQIRHNLIVQNKEFEKEQKEIDRNEQILTAYRAYSILQKELSNGNDLREYLDKGAPEIVVDFYKEYPDEKVGIQNKQTVIEMYKRGQFPHLEKEIRNPGYLVRYMRRGEKTKDGYVGGMRQLLATIQNKRAERIFELYTRYMIEKNHPYMSEEEKNIASKQLVESAPSPEEYLRMRGNVIHLYNEGMLSERLSDMIDQELELLPLPRIDEIEDVENMRISRSSSEEESVRSSSTSSPDDPIKQMFRSKDDRKLLIREIQEFTGKSSKRYKKYNNEELVEILNKYKSANKYKKKAGVWRVATKHGRAMTYIIGEKTGEKPTEDEIEQMIVKYNAKGGKQVLYDETQGRYPNVFVMWIPSFVPDSASEDEDIEVETEYNKPVGKPVEIRPIVDENEEKWRPFSPIHEEMFAVNNSSYPSVSVYITTMLLTHTGVKTDIKNSTIYKRGTPLRDARALLMRDNTFVSPDEASEIYNRRNMETHEELLRTFCRIALHKKFQDHNLQNLLLSTGNMQILWMDPNDTVLGAGSKKNPWQNFVGKELMNIRVIIREERKDEPPIRMNPGSIERFIMDDQFMNNWIKMRLSDMCTTVHKLKTYLSKAENLEENIDAEFTKKVLDDIYQPCSNLVSFSKRMDIPVPEYFVRLLSSCKGMKIQFSEDFDKKIRELDAERKRAENDFWGVVPKRVNTEYTKINPIELAEKQAKIIEKMVKNGATEKEIEEKEEEHNMQYDLALKEWEREEKKTQSLEERQNKEWEEFMKDIMRPSIPSAELERKIRKYENKMRRNSDAKKEKYRKKIQELKTLLSKPRRSGKERSELIAEKRKEQQEKYQRHYGIRTAKRSKKEIEYHERMMKNIDEQIVMLHRKRKEEIMHWERNNKDIAQVYWDRIISMVYFVMKHLEKSNEQNIRDIIISAELMNSKKAVCDNGESTLPDPQDNCISSALTNLLIGIQNFKEQYGQSTPIGKMDIDLAGSIILNKNVHQNRVEEKIPDVKEEIDLEFTNDLASNTSVEDFVDYGSEPGSFGMSSPKDELEQINILLQRISPEEIEDVNNISTYFLGMINVIKTFKMSNSVKQNRINFFATIR